ncbi:amidohydrolase family protein [Paenibacillus agricola]|uniref:Amidohydrolase family protein n=1 Tax=Paenibacillus agricola TaxID=2716264 RepID=A0ABX0IZU3_9BACL|nr:amidohydrolase family protein [Paenibacillus agricola]NHN28953.1 amidohydrolase family protein [Paenibacillus agricola]
MPTKITDAYAHFGLPRFGSLDQLLRYMDKHQIEQAVAVLGPRVPDFSIIMEAASSFPDRVRCVGIPFGETKEQRVEAVKLQLDAGAIGIRLEPREANDMPEILDLIGKRGRWAYGIGSCLSQQLAKQYLDWLAQYPDARLAAPHFMYADFSRNDPERAGGSIEQLMRHERFYGILVRNLGMVGSLYPHTAYKAWMEYVIELCGSDRLMWGSEYPVLFWRNENADAAVAMFRELLGVCDDREWSQIAGANASEQFFDGAAPQSTEQVLPEWVEQQFERNRTVPFFPKGLEIPVELYGRILEGYIQSSYFAEGRSMLEYILKPWIEQMDSGHGEIGGSMGKWNIRH